MNAKTKDDEIKQALIADAADPNAWERVAVVGPSTSRRPAWYGKSRARDVHGVSRETAVLRRKQLHDAIANLSEGQRQVIQLWLDGFQYVDIARALHISSDAVKSRLREAKRHLQPIVATRSTPVDTDDHRRGGTNR